ncbi:MAG TPA: TolC family protein [Candidatus Polarisedimenticolia bacterium]|jgi:outer membrane protein|nr:TolC family protein [Candidatus Polarisedimenticolia bacterium]
MTSRGWTLAAIATWLAVCVTGLGAEDSPPRSLPLKAGAPASLDAARARGYATLLDVFEVAVAQNEQVLRAGEDTAQARLLRLQARAAILPHLSFEDNYYRQNKVNTVTTSVVPGTVTPPSDNRNQAFIKLEQTIFSGLRDRSFLAYSRSNIEAFEHLEEDARRLLYASVAQAFYAVLQKEGAVKALEDSVKVERERAREIQARHEAGLARRTEVLLVQSQLAEDESTLTRALNDLEVAREQLGFVVTIPVDLPLRDDLIVPDLAAAASARPSTASPEPSEAAPPSPAPAEPSGAFPGSSTPALEAMLREAKTARRDLKALEKQVDAARFQITLARGEYYPDVSLEVDRYLERQNYSTFQQETDWSAQVDFTFPIFDGGRIHANVLQAQSRLRQLALDRDELERRIALEVETAWRTLQSDAAQRATLEVSVASAEENDRLVQEEYRNGLATNLEVITGHNQLLAARLDLERQKYQVKLDWVALKLFQGLYLTPAEFAPPAPSAPAAEGSKPAMTPNGVGGAP